MKTKPNTKSCPEPLDIAAQGSKTQHQNPPFPMSTPKASGDSLLIHHQHILIPYLGCVFSFITALFTVVLFTAALFTVSAVNKAVVIHPCSSPAKNPKPGWRCQLITDFLHLAAQGQGNHWFGCLCSCPDRNCLPPPVSLASPPGRVLPNAGARWRCQGLPPSPLP